MTNTPKKKHLKMPVIVLHRLCRTKKTTNIYQLHIKWEKLAPDKFHYITF